MAVKDKRPDKSPASKQFIWHIKVRIQSGLGKSPIKMTLRIFLSVMTSLHQRYLTDKTRIVPIFIGGLQITLFLNNHSPPIRT